MNRFGTTVLATLATLVFSTSVLAQQQKTLKITSIFTATHFQWTESLKIFTEKVTQASGGAIKFEAYHAGSLSKEGVGPLVSGLADIAVLPPSDEPAKLPLGAVAELPGMYTNSCEGTAKWWNIAKEGGALNNAEMKPLNIHVLYGNILPPFTVVTGGKKVANLEDLAGLKIRANGGAHDKTVRALGAVPVRVTVNELYDALSRKTIDGGFWAMGSSRIAGVEKVFRHGVLGTQLGSAGIFVGMSKRSWNALTPEQQAIFTKAAAETQQHMCEFVDRIERDELSILAKDHGWTYATLTKDEAARWAARVAPVAAEWAKEIDSTGRPGSALLKAFREAPAR